MLLKNILDYVGILSTNFMTKIEHVTRIKTTITTMLEYQDLPFGDRPQDEFGIRILGCMNCFGFIVWKQV